MEKVDIPPDEFLGSLPDEIRGAMTELDAIITSCLPGRTRVLWEGPFWGGSDQRIIGYGAIVQPRPRGEPVEWFLVGLARQQRYFSLYVNAVLGGSYLLARYADRLGTALLTQAHDVTPEDV